MSSVILLLTILTLGFFSLKSLKNPGYALGILWAMFSVEQYLQSASGFFVQYRSLVNFGITGLAIWAIGLSYIRGQLPPCRNWCPTLGKSVCRTGQQRSFCVRIHDILR